jgi:hypothetical protein
MKELLEQITELVQTFNENANVQLEKGNKAAGARARKASSELGKKLAEFRKVSLAEAKA